MFLHSSFFLGRNRSGAVRNEMKAKKHSNEIEEQANLHFEVFNLNRIKFLVNTIGFRLFAFNHFF